MLRSTTRRLSGCEEYGWGDIQPIDNTGRERQRSFNESGFTQYQESSPLALNDETPFSMPENHPGSHM
jgi:hypothetical protein